MLKGYKIVYTASDYTLNEKTLEKKYFNSQKTEIVIFLPAESSTSDVLNEAIKDLQSRGALCIEKAEDKLLMGYYLVCILQSIEDINQRTLTELDRIESITPVTPEELFHELK